jgi:hypothetical protein
MGAGYRARFLAWAGGGAVGCGVCFGAVAGSSFASAERSGSRRGARGNLSVSMARRIAAVTAASSSSVRSIFGTGWMIIGRHLSSKEGVDFATRRCVDRGRVRAPTDFFTRSMGRLVLIRTTGHQDVQYERTPLVVDGPGLESVQETLAEKEIASAWRYASNHVLQCLCHRF